MNDSLGWQRQTMIFELEIFHVIWTRIKKGKNTLTPDYHEVAR